MASLAQTIRSFQSGGLSHNEFLAQVDRVLAANQDDAGRLMEILSEEHTKVPLPPEVYAEVERRIGARSGAETGEETRVQTGPSDRLNPLLASLAAGPPSGGTALSGQEAVKGVGDTLNGRFVLEECLGFGGMGMVYKALDLRKLEASDRNPYIAIKVLNVQFRGHPKSLIALQREAKKAQKLAHPNIVTVYDFDRDGPLVYLTMEYLSGQPLSRTLRQAEFKGMPLAKALPIVAGMAKALAYAHERGFVHCDLKPANVFLTDGGEVKVIDFGIARVFQKPAEEVEATVFDPGSLGGLTPAYASPEMLEHREPDPRDDIYALACISYELLTGRHPFDRVSATQARGAGMKPARPAGLGRRQWNALKAALAFDRQARTPTVEGFLADMKSETRPMRVLGIAGAGIVVLAAVIVGLLWDRSGRQAGEGGAVRHPDAPLTAAAVAPVLAAVPCSALAGTVDGHALAVGGYVSRDYGQQRLKDQVEAIPGVGTATLSVQEVDDEKCAMVETFAPWWRANREAGGGATIRSRAPGGSLTEDEPLVLDITTPAWSTWVYVDYYVLDGSVAHLLPNARARDNQAPAGHSATLGGMGDWVISRPFGTELIALVTTPAPLFDDLRPEYESRKEYLAAVRARLDQLSRKYGAEKVAVDFVQISTKGKGE